MQRTLEIGFVTVACVLLSSAMLKAQPNQQWEALPYASTYLFDSKGQDLSGIDGLVFQMVVDVNGDTLISNMLAVGRSGTGWGVGNDYRMAEGSPADYNAQDDVVIAQFNTWESHPDHPMGRLPNTGQFLVTSNGTNYWARRFYFRWFNCTNPATATEAGLIYNPNEGEQAWVTPGSEVVQENPSSLRYGFAPFGGIAIQGSAANGYSVFLEDMTNGWQTMPLAGMLTVTSEHGEADPGAGNHWIAPGALVEAAVTNAPVTVGATQYVVVGWAGTGSATNSSPPEHPETHYFNQQQSMAFTFTNTSTLTWLWATNYLLTLNIEGDGSGSLDVESGWRKSDGAFTVTATSDDFMEFIGWSGDTAGCTIVSNTLTVNSMDGPRSITASFDYGYTEMGTPVRWYVGREMWPDELEGEDWDDIDMQDPDGDGYLNWQEYVAGTDPLDGDSYLRMLRVSRDAGQRTTLKWFGGIGPNTDWIIYDRYDMSAGDWSAVTNVPRAEGTMTNIWMSAPNATSNTIFYRVRAPRW